MTTVDKKFITKIKDKEFVVFEGLLDMFHRNGGKDVSTELIKVTGKGTVIFKAVVSGERGAFEAHGDANAENVNSMIAPHFIRMAETRAIARAMRLYNNIGMTSAEEIA